MKTIKEKILEQIQSEKLEMRPQFYFTLKVAALIILALAILAISVFIFNFILFSLRINGQEELLHFGPRGFSAFLHFFPWSWLLLDLIFIGFLGHLIRRFKFGYKVPALYLGGAIVLLTLLVGFTFDRGTRVNDRVFVRAVHHPIPPREGICKCTVIDVDGNKMIVIDNRFGTTTRFSVILPFDVPYATTSRIQKGDVVFIAGDLRDDVIHAFGVKKLIRRDRVPGDRIPPMSQ